MALSQVEYRVGGVEIQVVQDDGSATLNRPLPAAAAAERLISREEVHALIGGITSQTTVPVAAIAESAATPFIAVTENYGEVAADQGFVFFTAPTDRQQAVALARFARSHLGARTAAIFYDLTSPSSYRLAHSFQETFKEGGGEVDQLVALEGQDELPALQIEEALATMVTSAPDVLYLPLNPDVAGRLLNLARAVEISSLPLGTWPWNEDFAPTYQVGEGNSLVFPAHFHPDRPDPVTQEFVADYREQYETNPTTAAALAYDAVSRVLWAVEGALASGRLDLSDTASARIVVQSLLRQPGEYRGVTGSWHIDDPDNASKTVTIVRHTSGTASQVEYAGEALP